MKRIWLIAAVLGIPLAASVSACGGTVVFEEDGGDGGAGNGGNGSTSSRAATVGSTGTLGSSQTSASAATAGGSFPDTVAASVSTGPFFCTSHEDCGEGNLCIFGTGECTPPCSPDSCDSCGPGYVCDGCATSSCPGCKDCRSACMPIPAGRCDDDDACPSGEACNFFTSSCEDACRSDGTCGNPAKFCDTCATSTCCGCDSCSGLCIFGDD